MILSVVCFCVSCADITSCLFPWLKEVDSLALCNAQLHLQTAYKNFFRDSSVGFPKVQVKKESGKKL